MWCFIAGFLTRAIIGYVSDRTWQWRLHRAMRREAERESVVMRWRVKLTGITWDDGKGQYDVSDLPKEWSVIVIADHENDAIEYALTDATDSCGSLVEGYQSARVQRVK